MCFTAMPNILFYCVVRVYLGKLEGHHGVVTF